MGESIIYLFMFYKKNGEEGKEDMGKVAHKEDGEGGLKEMWGRRLKGDIEIELCFALNQT